MLRKKRYRSDSERKTVNKIIAVGISLVLFLITSLMISAATAKSEIAEENLAIQGAVQICAANLQKIHAGITAYEKRKGELPNWLGFPTASTRRCPRGWSGYQSQKGVPGARLHETRNHEINERHRSG